MNKVLPRNIRYFLNQAKICINYLPIYEEYANGAVPAFLQNALSDERKLNVEP